MIETEEMPGSSFCILTTQLEFLKKSLEMFSVQKKGGSDSKTPSTSVCPSSKNVKASCQDTADTPSKILQPTDGMHKLCSQFVPGPLDVICARGKKATQHSGNQRFRALIKMNLPKYSQASSKLDKSLLVSSIIKAVRQASPDGGFVREEDDGSWYEVGDHFAREKCGQWYVRLCVSCPNKSMIENLT
jgi:hypothetical protein